MRATERAAVEVGVVQFDAGHDGNSLAALACDEACILTSEQRRGTTRDGWKTVETGTAG